MNRSQLDLHDANEQELNTSARELTFDDCFVQMRFGILGRRSLSRSSTGATQTVFWGKQRGGVRRGV